MKLGDGGGGEDGLKRLGKRAADEDALEGEGAGGGDPAEDGGGTKRDGKTPRGGGAPAPASGPQAPSPPPACPQDQHHFLRSSVRPQSKRLRKDSAGAGGSGGGSTSGSGPRGKGRGTPGPSRMCPALSLTFVPSLQPLIPLLHLSPIWGCTLEEKCLFLLPRGCSSLCLNHDKRQEVSCLWASTIGS